MVSIDDYNNSLGLKKGGKFTLFTATEFMEDLYSGKSGAVYKNYALDPTRKPLPRGMTPISHARSNKRPYRKIPTEDIKTILETSEEQNCSITTSGRPSLKQPEDPARRSAQATTKAKPAPLSPA